MTTTTAHHKRGLLLSLLTLLTLLGAILVSPVDASASTHAATETRVRALAPRTPVLVAARDLGSSTTVGVSSVWLRQQASATGVATNSLATGTDEAVFWSGIRGGDSAAASWAAKNGGASLESTLAQGGVSLPAWDATNPSAVAAWRSASADFAAGARGTVRVLQEDAVRVNSVWAEVEFPALKANPNVTSIRGVDPRTGAETVLWDR